MRARVVLYRLPMLGSIVALGVLPGIASSQAEPAADPAERILEAIDAAQEAEGPRSPALVQLLAELGTLYQAEGQNVLSTAVLEEARHVVRATYGLHTLEQMPLLQQALANQRALGDFAMVEALEEELLDLAERHPSDLRTVAIHRDAALRRQDVLRRFLAGEAPGEVYPEAGLFWFDKEGVISGLVSDAQTHFADAAAVILRNKLYSSDELRELEMEIVRIGDVVRQRSRSRIHSRLPRNPVMENIATVSNSRLYRDDGSPVYAPELVERTNTLSDLASRADFPDVLDAVPVGTTSVFDVLTTRYQLGRDSYSRLITYDQAAFGPAADEATLRKRLEAYLRLADWDLLYSQNGAAVDQYAQVHELLMTADFGEPLAAEIFSPPIPTVLPTFLPNPLETQPSAHYIDVSFEVTRFGESRRVEILGAAGNVSAAAKDELMTLIKGSRFRPRVTDGELAKAAPVVVRYYLDD